MMYSTKNENNIKVAVQGSCAYVRIQGRGSFKNAPALKRFAGRVLDHGSTHMVLDMAACTGMDSTFMGVLASIGLRLHKQPESELQAINISPKNVSLLETLGLRQLIEIRSINEANVIPACVPGDSPLETLDASDVDRASSLETIRKAHETLADVSEDNRLKFKDVLRYLDQPIG